MKQASSLILVAVGMFLSLGSAVSADTVPAPAPLTSPGSGGIVDDNDAGWIFRAMVEVEDPSMHGGGGHAGGPGAYCAYTFQGTGIEVVGMAGPSVTVDGRAHKMGRAKITIDGKPEDTINVARHDVAYEYSVYSLGNLKNGVHVLEIEPDAGWIVIDYIKVQTSGSNNDPTVSTPGPGLGGKPSSDQKPGDPSSTPSKGNQEPVYMMVNEQTGFVLDAPDGSALVVATAHGTPSQKWYIRARDGFPEGRFYQIVNVATATVLDAHFMPSVVLSAKPGGTDQLWRLTSAMGGYTVQFFGSGLSIGGATLGPATLARADSAPDQVWYIRQANP